MPLFLLFPPRWARLLALCSFATITCLLFWQGAQPHAVGLLDPPWDKVAHLLAFGTFGGLAWVMLGGTRPAADILAPLAAIAVGIADEWMQARLPGRHAGLDDLAADAIGALSVVLLLALLRERRRAAPARAATRP